MGSEGGGKVLTEAQALAVRRVLACKQKSVWAILQVRRPHSRSGVLSAACSLQHRTLSCAFCFLCVWRRTWLSA